ncbi:MAG: hypothetical protein NTX65_15405 [Ignavibacteriales bacterium]|nr:hypothetical protein [Ignavibacteriales bacterium]
MMKSKYLISFLILLTAGLIIAGVDLRSFTAKSSGGNVVLNWETNSETNFTYFVVQRKTVNGGYAEIGNIYPKSDRTYEFVDQTAFKTSGQVYVYRLKIVDNDGNVSYSGEVTVAHNSISSVKRTWGSIKALFR